MSRSILRMLSRTLHLFETRIPGFRLVTCGFRRAAVEQSNPSFAVAASLHNLAAELQFEQAGLQCVRVARVPELRSLDSGADGCRSDGDLNAPEAASDLDARNKLFVKLPVPPPQRYGDAVAVLVTASRAAAMARTAASTAWPSPCRLASQPDRCRKATCCLIRPAALIGLNLPVLLLRSGPLPCPKIDLERASTKSRRCALATTDLGEPCSLPPAVE
jgi:hypothetical protein